MQPGRIRAMPTHARLVAVFGHGEAMREAMGWRAATAIRHLHQQATGLERESGSAHRVRHLRQMLCIFGKVF